MLTIICLVVFVLAVQCGDLLGGVISPSMATVGRGVFAVAAGVGLIAMTKRAGAKRNR